MSALHIIMWLLLAAGAATQEKLEFADFQSIEGFDCVRDEFVETRPAANTENFCGFACTLKARCQAFATNDGMCRLFVFDKCSKNVRDCTCSKRAVIFVKQQHGVGLGSLCPADYANDRCGVKYRVEATARTWAEQKAVCDSDGGLSMMADVMDTGEWSHVGGMMNNLSYTEFHLGGKQQANSTEPAGGWYWNCELPIDASVWMIGQPNSAAAVDYAIGYKMNGVADRSGSGLHQAVCECVSPFN